MIRIDHRDERGEGGFQPENTAAIRAYEKAGFRKIGERRQSGYWLGQRVNEVLMDAIPEDFPGPSAVKNIVSQSL